MAKRKAGAGNSINMQDLARVGAEARLEALRAEQEALLVAFPDLRGSSSRPARPPQGRAGQAAGPAPRATRRRGVMTAAQRKAVGERMRAYWAARRAEKAGAAGAQSATEEGAATKSKGRKRARRK